MKTGDIFLSNEIKHRGFGPKDAKFGFKTKPGKLFVTMLLGVVTPDSLPHFSADGAIAALGYGPIMTSRGQRGLIDALGSVKVRLEEFVTDEGTPASSMAIEQLPQIDAALASAENFRAASAPVLDPILLNAARFDALINLLAKDPTASIALKCLLGNPDIDPVTRPLEERDYLISIIDAATKA